MTHEITSVWSSHGHRFMSDGGEDTESCLTCGAMYQLVASEDDPTRGEYTTISGGTPAECTRDPRMCHGYPGERYCHEHQHSEHECEHVSHSCPCLLCDS